MIVEVSRFRLTRGAAEADFLRAAEETQAGFLAHQPGFHSRELLRGDDGSWMDIVRFDSAQAAQAALQAFPGHRSVRAFESMLDVSDISMSHWSSVRTWSTSRSHEAGVPG